MNEVIAFGAHRMWVEGDVARVTHQGLVSLSEAQLAYGQVGRWHKEGKIQYLLIDMSRMLPYEPAVRKWLAADAPSLPLRAVVMVGMAAPLRIVLSLLERAVSLVGKSMSIHVVALKSVDEALTYFEEDRKKHRRGGA